MRWIKDQKLEANLRALGIKFEIERVKWKDIDLAEGIRRQTRLLGKLSEDTVMQYALAMALPEAAFPMILLQKPPRGKCWIWGGNHRGGSYEFAFSDIINDDTEIEAYTVCLSDPLMIDVLPRIVNCWESALGMSKEEKIINAKWLVEKHNMSTIEAGKLCNVKPEWINTAKRADDVTAKIADLGSKIATLSRTTKIQLGGLENLNVLKATAKLLVTYGLKGDEAYRIIQEVKSARGGTELAQMSELGKWETIMEERFKPKAKKPRKVMGQTPVRDSVLKHVTGLAKILEKNDTLEKLQLTDPADQEVVHRAWLVILKTMHKVAQQHANGKGS